MLVEWVSIDLQSQDTGVENCPSWVSLPTTAQTTSIIFTRGIKYSSSSNEMCLVFDELPYELMSNHSMEHCLWDFWKSQKTDQERSLGWWDRPSWWATFPCVLCIRAELVTVARSQVSRSTVSFSLSIRKVNHRQADKMTILERRAWVHSHFHNTNPN